MSIRISGSTGLHGNSITLNGALGATTPAAANVTTLSATGAISGTTVTATSIASSGFVGSSATGALKLPVGTTAERPVGAAGMVRYNSTRGLPEWYNTVMSMWDAFGTVTSPAITLLVVGGGGGGGSLHSGNNYGGGGGATSYSASLSITAGNQYTITVGAGGGGYPSPASGSSSSAFGQSAAGGTVRANAGAGPNGPYYSEFTAYGQGGYFGGGGGRGSIASPGNGYAGGLGGGVAGANTSSNASYPAPNTGGGGAGGNNSYNTSGPGSSGIVLLRYPDTYPAASATTGSPTVTVTGGYRYYAFLESGTFTF